MIPRFIATDIQNRLHQGKAIIILGPRQCGKTTLLDQVAGELPHKLYLNCDDADDRQALSTPTVNHLKQVVGNHTLILIDEAQRVSDIGIILKLLVDNFKGLQVIATGSSSFELSNRINEPLTGRKYEYHLHPFAYEELCLFFGAYAERRLLPDRLIYGSYPDVVNHPGGQQDVLNLLVGSYLYKDVFMFQDLRKPELLDKLLRALALQVGSEVSFTELAQLTQTDHTTIQRYIHLLEHAFIIFRLANHSTNQRNEIKRARKIYFWDNGVRNCLINDFRALDIRDDVGKIWENYIISERLKLLSNHRIYRNSYFWRNVHNAEVDYLELYEDKLAAFEIKWNPRRAIKTSGFMQLYSQATISKVDRDNYQDFLLGVEKNT